jgi:hypothetical protein
MPKKSYTPTDFHPKLRRSRTGLGLFATELIPANACVMEYTGKILTDAEYDASRSRYLFDLGNGKVLDGSPRWNRARYINHSCAPNCEAELHKGHVYIHALRDIQPGEELSYDYGSEYFEAFIGENCRCLKCMPAEPAAVAPEPMPVPAPVAPAPDASVTEARAA